MSKVDVTSYISETACTILIIICSIISALGGAYLGYKEAKYKYKVDTISVSSNDSIKLELKQLDKEKNEKIIQVKGLNNDSTYKLFKRLIAE